MSHSPKITIHMVSSLDGFIAKKDDSIEWMHSKDHYEEGKTLTTEEIEAYIAGIDCYIMGSKTYEHALKLGWPYGEKPVFVLTNRDLPQDRNTVSFYSGDLNRLVNEQLKPNYKNIWMVGGAELTKSFIQQDLADKIVLTLMPIILGEGLLFFDQVGSKRKLHLEDVVAYNDGMVEITYQIVKGEG